jgi:hypothetical protein
MASSTAFLEVALSNEYIFSNALNNDIVIYPSNESQDILLGSRSNANAALAMSVSNVNINVIPATSGGMISFTAGTTGNNNLMNILGNGNVGIGNTSPGFRLDVSGIINSTNAYQCAGGSNCFRATNTDPGDIVAMRYGAGDRYGFGQYAIAITRMFAAGAVSTSSIRLSGATNDVMTGSAGMNDIVTVITGSSNSRVGCVGIGTTAPNTQLHISGNALSNQLTFSVADGGTNAKNWAFGPNGNTFFGYILNDSFASSINWIQCTRSANAVTNVSFPSGNVGIGTTSPSSLLTVNGGVDTLLLTGGGNPINMSLSNNGGKADIGLAATIDQYMLGNSAGDMVIRNMRSSGRIHLLGGGNTGAAITINSNNNVGIGTISPSSRLSVAGDMNVTGTVTRAPIFGSRRVATTQNINSSSITTILFDAADVFNSASFPLSYSAGVWTNNSGQTVMCTISFTVSFTSNGTGVRQAWIVVNGANNVGRFAYISLSGLDILAGSATIVLNNGETFGINTWQTSGATASVGGAVGGMDTGFSTRIQIGII